MPRPPLERLVRDPGFTPSSKDIGELVDLLVDETLGEDAERAIARGGPGAILTLQDRFERADARLRARIVRAAGRLAGRDEVDVERLLVRAIDDPDPKTRRNAAIALGRARSSADVEDVLLAAWDREERPEMRRSIAASLGKVGGERSLGVLRQAALATDAELARIGGRAVAMVERTVSRVHRGRLVPASAPAHPVSVIALARRGLEELLAAELARVTTVRDVRVTGPGRVSAQLAGPMSALFAARTMTWFEFPLPALDPASRDDLKETLARTVTSAEARRILSTWTEGGVRYRIAWARGGHKRALTWDVAAAVVARAPELVNDPTASLWEFICDEGDRSPAVSLVPRALDDPRFVWRVSDVPAASHPTIAAALARVAGVRSDDVVWDPFVGSAAELVERALLGPFASLEGTDIDERALAAARRNLDRAGVRARLLRAAAIEHAPRDVTLVLTNPPMGRRASRTSSLAGDLDRFVVHAASRLVVGGRLVWIAPWPERARRAAAGAGLALDWARVVDMGGFEAELQRWIKRR